MNVEQINREQRGALDHAESLLPGRWRFRLRIEQRTGLNDVRFHWLNDAGEPMNASPWYSDLEDFQEHIEDMGAIIDSGITASGRYNYRSEVVS